MVTISGYRCIRHALYIAGDPMTPSRTYSSLARAKRHMCDGQMAYYLHAPADARPCIRHAGSVYWCSPTALDMEELARAVDAQEGTSYVAQHRACMHALIDTMPVSPAVSRHLHQSLQGVPMSLTPEESALLKLRETLPLKLANIIDMTFAELHGLCKDEGLKFVDGERCDKVEAALIQFVLDCDNETKLNSNPERNAQCKPEP